MIGKSKLQASEWEASSRTDWPSSWARDHRDDASSREFYRESRW